MKKIDLSLSTCLHAVLLYCHTNSLSFLSLTNLKYEKFGFPRQAWTAVSAERDHYFIYYEIRTTGTRYRVKVTVTQDADYQGSIVLMVFLSDFI